MSFTLVTHFTAFRNLIFPIYSKCWSTHGLTHFTPIFCFYTPWMHKKTSGGVEIGVLRGLELEQYFYFHSLCSLQGCPFQLEVFTKQSDHEVSAVDVSGVSKELEQALHESISMISKKTLIKNKKDLILHVAEFDQRISLAIENQVNNLFLLYIGNSIPSLKIWKIFQTVIFHGKLRWLWNILWRIKSGFQVPFRKDYAGIGRGANLNIFCEERSGLSSKDAENLGPRKPIK